VSREHLTQGELDAVNALVNDHAPVPAVLVKRLLSDRSLWVMRAFGQAPTPLVQMPHVGLGGPEPALLEVRKGMGLGDVGNTGPAKGWHEAPPTDTTEPTDKQGEK
jgi:hypothetical protein